MRKVRLDYVALVDDAMHIIVRKCLDLLSKNLLESDHHFYVSFYTDFPGVKLSKRLKARYPKEMTIVLQYQFDNLVVEKDRFSVMLSFDGISENIVIPFKAMSAFADPSMKFGLQFQHHFLDEALGGNDEYVHSFLSDDEEEPKKDKKKVAKKAKDTKETKVISLDQFRSKTKTS